MPIVKLLPLGLVCGILMAALRRSDDEDLARRLQTRNAKAMLDLYRRYSRPAYSLILHIVRDASLAEDLTQETFLRVWNQVQFFDARKGALGAWVLAVARNRAIHHVHSVEGRMQADASGFDSLDNPRYFSAIGADALSIDRARHLKSAFEQLTPQQRQVIEMAYYEGLSQTEMADRLKQPLGTVKTWMRGALQTLRRELAGVATA